MRFPSLSHHGGTRSVTGSCHQLHLDATTSLLIDCGLEQGPEAAPGAELSPIAFDIAGIQALVVTHVHLDHVGRIPALLAAGFRGPILCSEPSAKLLPLVLEDAYKLGISADPQQVERYLALLQRLIVAIPFDEWHPVIDCAAVSCNVRLQRAGHLLGSAYVECDLRYPGREPSTRVVFSGDLGAPCNPLYERSSRRSARISWCSRAPMVIDCTAAVPGDRWSWRPRSTGPWLTAALS